jgi:hypothetical protein
VEEAGSGKSNSSYTAVYDYGKTGSSDAFIWIEAFDKEEVNITNNWNMPAGISAEFHVKKFLCGNAAEWGVSDITMFRGRLQVAENFVVSPTLTYTAGQYLTFSGVYPNYTFSGANAAGTYFNFSASGAAVLKGLPNDLKVVVEEAPFANTDGNPIYCYCAAYCSSGTCPAGNITADFQSIGLIKVTNNFVAPGGALVIKKELSGSFNDWGVDSRTEFTARVKDITTGLYVNFTGGPVRFVYDGLSAEGTEVVFLPGRNAMLHMDGVPAGREFIVEEIVPDNARFTPYYGDIGNEVCAPIAVSPAVNQTLTIINHYEHGTGELVITKRLGGSFSDWGADNSKEFFIRVKDITDASSSNHFYMLFNEENDGEFFCYGNNGINNPDGTPHLAPGSAGYRPPADVLSVTAANSVILGNLRVNREYLVEELYRLPIREGNSTDGWGAVIGYEYRLVDNSLSYEPVYLIGGEPQQSFALNLNENVVMTILNNYEHAVGTIAVQKLLAGDFLNWGVNNNTVFRMMVRDITDSLDKGEDIFLNFAEDGWCGGNTWSDGKNWYPDAQGVYDGVSYSDIVEFSAAKPIVLKNLWAGHLYEIIEVTNDSNNTVAVPTSAAPDSRYHANYNEISLITGVPTDTCCCGDINNIIASLGAAGLEPIRGIPVWIDAPGEEGFKFSDGEERIPTQDSHIVDITNIFRPADGVMAVRKVLSGNHSHFANSNTRFEAAVHGAVSGKQLVFNPSADPSNLSFKGDYECIGYILGSQVYNLNDELQSWTEETDYLTAVLFSVAVPASIQNIPGGERFYPIEKTPANAAGQLQISYNNEYTGSNTIATITNTYYFDTGNLIVQKELSGDFSSYGVNNNTVFQAKVFDLTANSYLLFRSEADGTFTCVETAGAGVSETITFSAANPAELTNLRAGGRRYRVDEQNITADFTPAYTGNGQVLVKNTDTIVSVENNYVRNTVPAAGFAVTGQKNIAPLHPSGGAIPDSEQSRSFTFELVQLDSANENDVKAGGYSNTVTVNGAESFDFGIAGIAEAGTYYYRVREIASPNSDWNFDSKNVVVSFTVAQSDLDAIGAYMAAETLTPAILEEMFPAAAVSGVNLTFTNVYQNTPPDIPDPPVTTTRARTPSGGGGRTPTVTTTTTPPVTPPPVTTTTAPPPETPDSDSGAPPVTTTPPPEPLTTTPTAAPAPHTSPSPPAPPLSPDDDVPTVSISVSKSLVNVFGDEVSSEKMFAVTIFDEQMNMLDRITVPANGQSVSFNGLQPDSIYYVQEESGEGYIILGLEIPDVSFTENKAIAVRTPAFTSGHLEISVIARNQIEEYLDIPLFPPPRGSYEFPPDDLPIIELPDWMIPRGILDFDNNPRTGVRTIIPTYVAIGALGVVIALTLGVKRAKRKS